MMKSQDVFLFQLMHDLYRFKINDGTYKKKKKLMVLMYLQILDRFWMKCMGKR